MSFYKGSNYMKVARIVGMAIFLLFALMIWRLMDWVVILWPHPLMYVLIMVISSMVLVALPIRLFRPRTHFGWYLGIFVFFGVISWWAGPFSRMATKGHEHVHCGRATYSGFFYPIKDYMFNAFQDDLDVRNQLCWIRKMIIKVPTSFTTDEDLRNYYNLIAARLKKPDHKYRVALPAVLFLTGKILTNWDF